MLPTLLMRFGARLNTQWRSSGSIWETREHDEKEDTKYLS